MPDRIIPYPSNNDRGPGPLTTIAGWHALLALGFAGWVLTSPTTVSGGDGPFALTMPRGWMAAVLPRFLVAPGLGLSFAIAYGVSFLRPLRRRSGLVAGTVATAAGMAVTVLSLSIYAFTR